MTRGMALDPQDCAEDRLERQFAVKGGHAGACPPVMAKTGPFVAEMRNLGLKMRPKAAIGGAWRVPIRRAGRGVAAVVDGNHAYMIVLVFG